MTNPPDVAPVKPDPSEENDDVASARRNAKGNSMREGMQALLELLIEQRFDKLSAHASSRLDAATLDELYAMSMRMLTADKLDEVLWAPRNAPPSVAEHLGRELTSAEAVFFGAELEVVN